MVWFVKLATDPVTDIAAYYSSVFKVVSSPATSHEPA